MIPLDLWPLDGPASLLRWGILTGPRGRDTLGHAAALALLHIWTETP